jgi:hypothetical protein
MFKIATAIVNPPVGYSAAGFALVSDTDYAPIALTPIPSTTPATIDSSAMSIVAGIGSIAIPANFQSTTIKISGKTYQFTLDNPPSIGYFTRSNGNLIVGLFEPAIVPQTIGFYPYNPPIPTNFIQPPYPDICQEFPLKGELSWILTWEEQPTASLSFITLATEKDNVINYFSSQTKIIIYGVGFAPTGQISINEVSLSKSAIRLIEVNVSLTGYHAKFLDLYTTIGKQLFLPDCTAPPITQLNSPDSMSVQTLAQKVGTNLIGQQAYIDPRLLTSPAIPTTLGSQLQPDSIRVAGGFIDYNNPFAIEIKQYNSVRSHQVTESEIRSDIQSTVNNKLNLNGSNYGYYKTYDPSTKVSFGSQATQAPNTKSPKPEWQPKQPVASKTSEGDTNPSTNPYAGTQRDLSIVFDISGKRKRRKDIDLINGQPVHEYEQEWGWVAVAKDDFEFSDQTLVKITGTWRQIMSKDTYYTYNANNYLTQVNSSGFVLTRFRVENAQKPESLAVRIEGATPDPGEVANLKTFRFFSLPTFGSETYTLAPFSKYYSDIVEPKVQWSICLPDGSPTEISLTDKSWIPPYFTIEKIVEENSFASVENPKSTSLKPLPPLTTGKNSSFTERINVEAKSILALSENPKDPTYYTKTVDDRSSSGAQFNASLSISKSELINGRPPISTNRGAILEVVKSPEKNSSSSLTFKPFAISSGLSNEQVGYVTVNNINFPTAYSQQEALQAAQIDIDLINAKNTLQERMTIDWRPEIRPGDLLTYKVDDDVRSRRVVSVSQKIQIDGMVDGNPFITSAGTEIKLGVNIKTPVIVSKLQERNSTILV